MNLFTRKSDQIVSDISKPKDEKNNENRVKKHFLSSGESVVVRIPSSTCFNEYKSHISFNVGKKHKIYPSVCTSHLGENDAYCKATYVLYDDLNKLESEAKSLVGDSKTENEQKQKELKEKISEIKYNRKMLFGFFDLETGEEKVYEFTGGQGDDLVFQILEYKDSLNDYAFKVSKTGSGTDTTVTLTAILKMTPEQKEAFDGLNGLIFNEDLFAQTLFVKDEKYKLMDLEKLGFDLTRIGETPRNSSTSATAATTEQKDKLSDDDLPF